MHQDTIFGVVMFIFFIIPFCYFIGKDDDRSAKTIAIIAIIITILYSLSGLIHD